MQTSPRTTLDVSLGRLKISYSPGRFLRHVQRGPCGGVSGPLGFLSWFLIPKGVRWPAQIKLQLRKNSGVPLALYGFGKRPAPAAQAGSCYDLPCYFQNWKETL